MVAPVMGVSLKTEKQRCRCPVSRFRPWVRRAEGYWGITIEGHAWRCRWYFAARLRCPV